MPDLELQLSKQIGSGKFGEVFMGSDPVHGPVAVKMLRKNHPLSETDEQWSARKKALLSEGQRLSQADHDNVVRVYYLSEADGGNAVRLAMQLCTGGSLQAAFDKGPMTLAEVRKVWTDVTIGLQALHARGMLHRDIKPSNLLVEKGTVKLGDFGLVTDDLVLGYGSQAGYRDHLAIEVWQGEGTSKKTDFWALGMTIYRLLHGAEWYSRSVKPRFTIAKGGFANSLKWLPHVPKRWRTVIRKMMADDTRQRYQSAEQVLATLSKLETGTDWNCTVESSRVTWLANKNNRLIRVVWDKHSAFKYSWRAESEPTDGAGRKYALGGSNGQISYSQCEGELKDFFKSR